MTATARLSLTIDRTKVPAGGYRVVGLFGGMTTGTGVTGVSLSVTETRRCGGVPVVRKHTAAQAVKAFDNTGFNLGQRSGADFT